MGSGVPALPLCNRIPYADEICEKLDSAGSIRFCTLWQVYKQQKWLWIAADDCRRVVGILKYIYLRTLHSPRKCPALQITYT